MSRAVVLGAGRAPSALRRNLCANAISPVREQTSERLAAAFVETGRGLIVGAGLTSLLQASLATVLFAALGVPRAIVGALTFVASIVPAVGTSVVWLPVAVGLGLRGDWCSARCPFGWLGGSLRLPGNGGVRPRERLADSAGPRRGQRPGPLFLS